MKNELYLFNTLTRKKELFEPFNPPEVGYYSCGPTVYNYAHVGNLRSYFLADTLKRVLLHHGYNVTHVTNITDVGHLTDEADQGEDKMEKGAKRENKTVWEIAEFYTRSFKKDLQKLNIEMPDIWAKATDHIQEQIDLIKKLEKKGFTYIIDDGVYFDTSKFPNYGKLAQLDLENLMEGARVKKNGQKKNASDFALWKFSEKETKRAMEWQSPWGKGFPGWHIECSAMAMKYLGDYFDIHSGGIDHIPVHHTNEIAQSEAATGKPFAKYWLHNEFVVLPDDEKMSKSKDNFLTLSFLMEKGYDPLDYRYLLLGTQYRHPLSFSWTAMDAAKQGKEKIYQFARRITLLRDLKINNPNEKLLSDVQDNFNLAVSDDLNTPNALAVLFNFIKDINSQIDNDTLSVTPESVIGFLIDCDKILGIDIGKNLLDTPALPQDVIELLAQRELARNNKNFEKSDLLRSQIKDKGYSVEDTKNGQQVYPL